jgi:hypothetical protein
MQRRYPKATKVKIFYDALTVDKKKILGNSPPEDVLTKFNMWAQNVKSRGKWKIESIAKSVFIIARHVHDSKEKLDESGCASADSKIRALALMYKFYIIEINHAEDERQSQNVAAEKNLQQQILKAKDAKPLR